MSEHSGYKPRESDPVRNVRGAQLLGEECRLRFNEVIAQVDHCISTSKAHLASIRSEVAKNEQQMGTLALMEMQEEMRPVETVYVVSYHHVNLTP